MKILVFLLKGGDIELEVTPGDTVPDVKKAIENKVQHYPAADQMMFHQGNILKDGSTLEENNIAENNHIVIVLYKARRTSKRPRTSDITQAQPKKRVARSQVSTPSFLVPEPTTATAIHAVSTETTSGPAIGGPYVDPLQLLLQGMNVNYLGFMRNSEQLKAMRDIVQVDPQSLERMIEILDQKNSQLVRHIQDHPIYFQRFINEPIEGEEDFIAQKEQVFQMNLTEYAGRYKGRIRVLRLLHIAEQCTRYEFYRSGMELEALALAYDIVRHGGETPDVSLLTNIVGKIDGRLGASYELDHHWCLSMDNDFVIQNSLLQNDLKNATTEYEKLDCAFNIDVLYHERGKIRPFGLDSLVSDLHNICVDIEERNFFGMRQLIRQKMSSSRRHLSGGGTGFKLKFAAALAALNEGDYAIAASEFVMLFREPYGYEEVISSDDLIAYGLVCAFASYGGLDFQSFTLDLMYIDLESKELGGYLIKLRSYFLYRRFGVCLDLLKGLRERMLLDLYLYQHTDRLLSLVKENIIRLSIEEPERRNRFVDLVPEFTRPERE